jgi:Protein of unknown function (DUF4019)
MRAFTCWISLLALVSFVGAASPAAHETEKAAAQKAAESWLALTDAGDADRSWEAAAEPFRKAVSKEQWKASLQAVRGPLGKLRSRKLAGAQYATSLPGAPDGEYVVIQYEASFEKKGSAVETVTPMREKDGSWRVSGYYVR